MNDKPAPRRGRPRLDSRARHRMLAEIAKLDRPPVEDIDRATEALRGILREPVEETPGAPEPEEQTVPVAPREGRPDPQTPPEPAAHAPIPAPAIRESWSRLRQIHLDPNDLEDKLVITASRSVPAHGAFDVLRTRLVQALADKGWTRVAITSPTAGCGKSFTAINLAIALSRYEEYPTVLLDFDMRRPGLARYFGVERPGAIGDFLRGLTPLEDHFLRPAPNRLHIGDRLALGLNDRNEPYAAELFQQPETAAVLDQLEQTLAPRVILLDMPPALAQDDVIAARPHYDCYLMVVGGGMTTSDEIKEARKRIGEDKPVLGIVLNKADVEGDYAY